jgi:hypothetical protein
MNCSSSSTLSKMLWYKQDPGGSLVLLIDVYKSGELTKRGKLTAQLGGTRKDSFLTISAAVPGDSGTYFCACDHSDSQAPATCTETGSWGSTQWAASSSHPFCYEMW